MIVVKRIIIRWNHVLSPDRWILDLISENDMSFMFRVPDKLDYLAKNKYISDGDAIYIVDGTVGNEEIKFLNRKIKRM